MHMRLITRGTCPAAGSSTDASSIIGGILSFVSLTSMIVYIILQKEAAGQETVPAEGR